MTREEIRAYNTEYLRQRRAFRKQYPSLVEQDRVARRERYERQKRRRLEQVIATTAARGGGA